MEKLKVAQENQKNPNGSIIRSYKLSRLTVSYSLKQQQCIVSALCSYVIVSTCVLKNSA